MFDWFLRGTGGGAAGLKKIHDEFGEMIDAGRHAFELACRVFLEGAAPDAVRDELFATDGRINEAERRIRRMLVVHATVHGVTEFPACLVMMSVVKDAERVGDYAKNIFDVAVTAASEPAGEHRRRLEQLKANIMDLMHRCRQAYDRNDKNAARELIRDAKPIEEACEEQVHALLRSPGEAGDMAPAYTLVYRYFKRAASHTRNVASGVVQPVDALDFTDEITEPPR